MAILKDSIELVQKNRKQIVCCLCTCMFCMALTCSVIREYPKENKCFIVLR